ncbi:hypothetical protein BDN72DRAFT_846112 [Pluteus cervinus]|uniref:Uncharacterized protein n=1 Tax=Pluteus cervinus TaxID=181527 RepID=A0ACD3AHY0_9AGAR|nr:hypothetical protein BDN72DRAFT_846112 [Pluteus cervinus]
MKLSHSAPSQDSLPSRSDTLLNPHQHLVITRERRRIGPHLLLATCALVLVSAGAATVILLWLTVIHGIPETPGESTITSAFKVGAFLTSEGTKMNDDGTVTGKLVGLTMTTITTQLVALSSPFLVAMMAYCVAGVWLEEQQHPIDGGSNLPTPLQYGLLMKLSSTAGVMSLYETGKYFLFRRTKTREALPFLLTTAFISVFTIYGLTHLLTLADLWLHLTSATVLHNTTTPFSPVSLDYRFGVTVNETLCIPDRTYVTPCLVEHDGWAATFPYVAKNGMLISSNASSTSPSDVAPDSPIQSSLSVITLKDAEDLAVIVPTSVDPSISWSAPTFGIRSSCLSMTQSCTHITDVPGKAGGYMVSYNCSGAGYPYIPYDRTYWIRNFNFENPNTTGRVGAMLDDTVVQGALWQYYSRGHSLPENPQSIQIEMAWPLSITVPTSRNRSDVVYDPTFLANAFVVCDVEFFNLTVKHAGNRRFEVVGEMERSSRNFTAVMWEPLISQMVNLQLHANLQARALLERSDDNFIVAMNQELSRLSLGMFAGATISAPATDFYVTSSTLVGRYPIGPVVAYAFLLYLYSLIVLGIFFWASTLETALVKAHDGSTVPSLALAQNALTDPLVLVGMVFPGSLSGVKGSVSTDTADMFGERSRMGDGLRKRNRRGLPLGLSDSELGIGEDSRSIPRLTLGVVKEGEKAGMIFGVNELRDGVY